ncbi:hypothetical protein HK100_012512 [Physocladia obscura]|uniref:Cytochrome c domain-containing protein n=1 Tax=Physocladia obscura TaxID=109957 RepID=A0AAD5T0M8_9FUNG|nr:hypothetical protein HK100_012512 [Physocladia obscura]
MDTPNIPNQDPETKDKSIDIAVVAPIDPKLSVHSINPTDHEVADSAESTQAILVVSNAMSNAAPAAESTDLKQPVPNVDQIVSKHQHELKQTHSKTEFTCSICSTENLSGARFQCEDLVCEVKAYVECGNCNLKTNSAVMNLHLYDECTGCHEKMSAAFIDLGAIEVAVNENNLPVLTSLLKQVPSKTFAKLIKAGDKVLLPSSKKTLLVFAKELAELENPEITEIVSALETIIYCQHEHPLKNQHLRGSYRCNICASDKYGPFYSCEGDCDYRECANCHFKTKSEAANEHGLVLLDSPQSISCDCGCGKSTTKYHCQECNFDQCSDCFTKYCKDALILSAEQFERYIVSGNVAELQQLVKILGEESSINLEITLPHSGKKPLELALISEKSNEIAKILANGFAKKKSEDFYLYHEIVRHENLYLLKYALENKLGDVDAKTSMGWTALHIAAEKGLVEFLQLFLDNGADINMHGNERTALHRAAEFAISESAPDCVNHLILNGADITVTAHEGSGVMHYCHDAETAYILLLNGATVNSPIDENGNSPKSHLKNEGREKVLETIALFQKQRQAWKKERESPSAERQETVAIDMVLKAKNDELKRRVAALQTQLAAAKIKSPDALPDIVQTLFGNIVGLPKLKQEIGRWFRVQQIEQARRKMGLDTTAIHLPHMVLAGNPGTGKTTVARLLGQAMKMIGVSTGLCAEVSRDDLVGAAVGETEKKMKELFKKYQGGVIFIDEAYRLTESGADYGKVAFEAILTRMTEADNRTIFMFAGYTDQMAKFLDSNPGMRRRVEKQFIFDDYTVDELAEIFIASAKSRDYVIDTEVTPRLPLIFEESFTTRQRSMMNGGLAVNLFNAAKQALDSRLEPDVDDIENMIVTIQLVDVEAGAESLRSFNAQ